MSNPTAAISSEPESSSSDSFMVLWSITAPQKTFLADRLPDYKAALGKKSLPEFWDTLFEDWFKHWPSKDDGRALVEERKFLTDRIPDYKSAQAKKKLIDFWPFLYMHWFDRWPATEVAPQEVKEIRPPDRRPSCRRQFYQQGRPPHLPKAITPIHEEIEQHLDQLKHDNSEGSPDPGDEAEDDEVKRALEYQAAIDAIPFSIEQAGAQIFKQSGLISLTMVAGPDPKQGGNLLIYRYTACAKTVAWYLPPTVIPMGSCHLVRASSTTLRTSRQILRTNSISSQKWYSVCRPSNSTVTSQLTCCLAPSERAKRSLPGTEKYRNYQLPPAAHEAATTPVLDSEKAKGTATVSPSVSQVQDEPDESSDSDSDIDVTLTLRSSPPRRAFSSCV
ncbi:hypothetical protein IMY05_C2493000100 [Salix suchowensis]|nr:hypothetical protein IMY05_C2493000100 [Salix suchowensis]